MRRIGAQELEGECAEAPAPSQLPREWTSTSTDASVIPVIVSSEQACGSDRLVLSLIDRASNAPAASPDRSVRLAFFSLGRDTTEAEIDRVLEIVPGVVERVRAASPTLAS